MLTLFVSPSQYSAQLKAWGLRTYKTKGAVPTHSERRGLDAPARQVNSETDQESKSQSYLHDRTPAPELPPVNRRSTFENLNDNGVYGGQQQLAINALSPDFPLLDEASDLTREEDDAHSEQSPPPARAVQSPQIAEKVYPHFNALETVQDAVRRVVQALSEVLADPELEEFFDNLTDAELDELLLNHVKLKAVCDDALVKHTGKLWRVGESFGPRPTRLVQIVRETSS